jgi:hypothetical protein
MKKESMNSLDEIIEIYKRDVDVTMIDASLRRTVEERILALEEFERFREALHAATERTRDPLR